MRRNRTGTLVVRGMVALSGIVCLTGELWAAASGTQDVSVDAVIQQTISTASPKNLNFGTVELDPAGDTITIDASAGSSTTATKLNGSNVSGSVQSGSVTVTSPLSFDILVEYPASVTLDGAASASNHLTVQSISDNSQGSITAPTAHTGGVTSTFNIGGVLNLPVTTVADIYHGTMTVKLTYQ